MDIGSFGVVLTSAIECRMQSAVQSNTIPINLPTAISRPKFDLNSQVTTSEGVPIGVATLATQTRSEGCLCVKDQYPDLESSALSLLYRVFFSHPERHRGRKKTPNRVRTGPPGIG